MQQSSQKFEADIRADLANYVREEEARLQAVRQAIQALDPSSIVEEVASQEPSAPQKKKVGRPKKTETAPKESPVLSVSPERKAKVREAIERHPDGVRQTDIAKDLGENSGTVSVALRIMESEGLVEYLGKRDGAKAWRPKASKVVSINKGKGRKGRRKAADPAPASEASTSAAS